MTDIEKKLRDKIGKMKEEYKEELELSMKFWLDTLKDDIQHTNSFSEEILYKRFTMFIEELKENNNFLEILSITLGEMFAHNVCCHQGYNLPDIEDIDFNKFIKDIKTSFYKERMGMNDECYFQLEKTPSLEETEAYERNKESYEHRLESVKKGLP